MTAHALKLSLGLLFGIRNILSLEWGNSRTRLSEKEKNVDDYEYTHKKIAKNKKIKSQKKWSLKKKGMFLSKKIIIKRQIVLLFYPSCLNQGRKDDNTLMF